MLFALVAARSAAAQPRYQTLGPNECINCHDHQEERLWWEKKEIPEVRRLFRERGDKAGHINALKQLDEKKGDAWATAVGVKDKYDAKGVCVRCHGTVFIGEANAGVSCESCHGPASGYLKPHQTKGAYEQSVGLGMTRLVGNLQGWAQQCTTCHVMDDARLVQAGHPSGDDFDLGAKFKPVSLHFKKKYSAAEISAIGRPMVQALQRKRGGPAVATAPPPVPPPPQQQQQQPPPPPVQQQQQAPPPPAGSQQTIATTTTVPPAVDPGPATTTTTVPARTASNDTRPPDVPQPMVTPTAGVTPTPAPAASPAVGALPASASALLAMLQGRVIAALTDVLQRGAAAPLPAKARAPLASRYTGPDAALLQLQADAIALALEALGTAPATSPPRR